MSECGKCPVSQCSYVSQIIPRSPDPPENTPRVGLIAGLTTGLVAVALIAVTVAGLVFYRRRQQQKKSTNDREVCDDDLYSFRPELSPVPPMSTFAHTQLPATLTLQPDSHLDYGYGHVCASPSPSLLIGTSPLQIPHLETPTPVFASPPKPTSAVIRRSLNILPTHTPDSSLINRSSSVKVSKYDNIRPYPRPVGFSDNPFEDLDDESKVQIKRAVSVRKTRDVSRSPSAASNTFVASQEEGMPAIKVICAKPTMVRINTISRNEAGITRKRSVRTAINNNNNNDSVQSSSGSSSDLTNTTFLTPSGSTVDPHKRTRAESLVSVHSTAESTHSTIGDGEITVIWDASRPTSRHSLSQDCLSDCP
ncbi:hypothetical protein CLU79DRAFT_743736 [Phycomyces nitens]|nr:hypothetical protein CLU79DRAFT_743736 [Phycomyces nitens]